MSEESKIIFNDHIIEDLVKTRNNEPYKRLFNTTPIGIKKMKIWESIAEEMGYPGEGKILSLKYRDLLKVYRKKLAESRLSGNDNSAIKWKYYDIFNEALDSNVELFPDNVNDSLSAPPIEQENEPVNKRKKFSTNSDLIDIIKNSNEESTNFLREMKELIKLESAEKTEIKKLKEDVEELKNGQKKIIDFIDKLSKKF